jgi:hypothetical protein
LARLLVVIEFAASRGMTIEQTVDSRQRAVQPPSKIPPRGRGRKRHSDVFRNVAAISLVLLTSDARNRNCSAVKRNSMILKTPISGPIIITIAPNVPSFRKSKPIMLKRKFASLPKKIDATSPTPALIIRNLVISMMFFLFASFKTEKSCRKVSTVSLSVSTK